MAENPDRPLDQDPGGSGPARTSEHAMTRTEPGGEHRAPRSRRSFASGADGDPS